MTVDLTPETAAFVNEEVSSGRFADPAAVVAAAIKSLEVRTREETARQMRLQCEVQIGLRELDAGLGVPFDDSLIDEILAEIESEQAPVEAKRT